MTVSLTPAARSSPAARTDAAAHQMGSGLRHLIRGILLHRLLLIPVAVAGLVTAQPVVGIAPVLAVLAADFVATGVVVLAAVPRLARSDASRFVIGADLVLSVVLVLWSVQAVPDPIGGTFDSPFWFHLQGTVALAVALHGRRRAGVLCALGIPLTLLTAAVDGPVDLPTLAGLTVVNVGWLVVAAGLADLIIGILRRGAELSRVEGVRAGRAAEQVTQLRTIHDTVLQTMESIAMRRDTDRTDPRARLAEVQGIAVAQAAALRRMLAAMRDGDDHAVPPIAAELDRLVEEFGLRGLRIELVTSGLDRIGRSAAAGAAVPAALREALTNVLKHAGVDSAVVRVVATPTLLTAVVRDQGRGFVPDRTGRGFGVAESIAARIREAGGDAVVRSAPGRGTRVTLTVPIPPQPGASAGRVARP